MKPYVMTALRTPLIWIVPAVLLPLLVAIGAVVTSRQVEVQASVWTQRSSLIDTPGVALKVPAQTEADAFNERLGTESFQASVLTAAGLDDQAQNGTWPGESSLASLLKKSALTKPLAGLFGGVSSGDVDSNRTRALDAVKSSVTAAAQGDSLIYITYTGTDEETGIALVNGAVDVYQKESLGLSSADAQAVLDFYAKQVAEKQQALEDQDTSLRAFEAEHPAAVGALRPPSEAQQLAQLQSIYNIRLSEYELAMTRQGDAQLRAQAALTSSGADFQVVDPARAPHGTTIALRRAAALTFVGIVFGFGLGALLIVLRTWFDDTVRRGEDVRKLLGLDLLAALPDLEKGGR
jgi:capsular polysaccharide biosynthesis protein